jgi:hypothetical protein
MSTWPWLAASCLLYTFATWVHWRTIEHAFEIELLVVVRTIGGLSQVNRSIPRHDLRFSDAWLETYCLPIAARIAGGEVAAVELPDHLTAAELVVVVHRHDAVPAAL